MKYISTRGRTSQASLAEAIITGLAPDGGLYVPAKMPEIDPQPLRGASQAEVGQAVLRGFSGESPDASSAIAHAYRDAVRLSHVGGDTHVLELYWGASAAFKDYGAQFLGEYLPMCHHAVNPGGGRVTVMVATSGDTGGAVAAAFWRKPEVDVFVLYPEGRVSARQEHQLCAWGDNVRAIAVRGSFDECQALVKGAFKDPFWTSDRFLTSANSINVGRLLPQVVYYAWASLQFDEAPSFVVPTGNLGNALACMWARAIGFPIDRIVLATNANRTLLDYYETGDYRGRASVATLANAMDVGDPSNFERARHLYPTHAEFCDAVDVMRVDDETIRQTITRGEADWGCVFDPHTACAMWVREQLDGGPWVVASTAHPAKFESIVEPLIGHEVALPPALVDILKRPTSNAVIDPDAQSLKRVVANAGSSED